MSKYFTRIKKELITSSLSDKAFRVLSFLIFMSRNGECFPSMRTIASQLNKSLESVRTAMKELEDNNLIVIENRTIGTGKKTSNSYKIADELLVKTPKKEGPRTFKSTDDKYKILDYDWL